MGMIIKIRQQLHFKSVAKSKKAVIFCTNPCTSDDVARVQSLRDNRGSNSGDTEMQFGKLKAKGFSLLPNFGTNYFAAMDTNDYKPKDLPKVGDKFELDTLVDFPEDVINEVMDNNPDLAPTELAEILTEDYLHTSFPAKQVLDKKGKPVNNMFWGYLIKN